MAVKRWNGSAWVVNAGSIANATSANTVSTIVQRDGSGNFSVGEVTAASVVTSSITGSTTATAFNTTNSLTVGQSTGYTDVNATSNVLSGGSITGSTANTYITDNYSVRNLVSNFNDLTHTINIGTGTVTNNSNYSDKYINIGTGNINSGGNTYINLGASGATVTVNGTAQLPSNTSIGTVSSTEIGYVDGVTSNIQTQLNSKERLVAKLTAATAAIANTETVVLSFTAAANTIVAGDVFRFTGYATATGSTAASPILRIRIGTTTLTGATTASVTTAAATSSVTNFRFEAMVTCRTAGSSGTIGGAGNVLYGGGTYTGGVTATATVNTTVQNLVEVTFISGLASRTYVFDHAILEKLPN